MDAPIVEETSLPVVTPAREATVLLGDIVGLSKFYAVAGDLKAVELIARCRNGLREVVQSEGGRILRTMGERLMALFPSPDAAALASTRMHLLVEGLTPLDGVKLSLKMAFHHGSLIQREDEVFGDTVDATARMLDHALKGQTLLLQASLHTLSPIVRGCGRPCREATDDAVATVWELAWRKSPDVTDLGVRPTLAPQTVLRLNYRGQTIVRRRTNEALRIGRDESCDVVVPERKASRQHCTIERKPNGFVLRDHSSNGTYVTPVNEKEIFVFGEEMTLRSAGVIAFGVPRSEAAECMEYQSERTPQ